MSKSKKLIFFGTENFSLSALEALVENNYDVLAVVTKPDSRRGRGKAFTSSPVKQFAIDSGIPVIQSSDGQEMERKLAEYQTDFAVLSAFGKIIPDSILNMFPGGIINIHPSLLPKYRGASPIEQAILNGDENTGVSLMKLIKEMDAGPIFAQSKIELDSTETAPELYRALGKLGSQLLIEKLPDIISKQLPIVEQDDELASVAPMITKPDGRINWDKTAETLERQIRAYLRWPGSKITINDTEITITQARLGKKSGKPGELFVQENEFGVYCKDTSVIVEKLKPAGKREMHTSEFLAGNKVI